MAALQGLPGPIIHRLTNTSVSGGNVGAAIGDAMSINVLMRLIPAALACAGMISERQAKKIDFWKNASKTSGMMPDALYCANGCTDRLC
jgi:hypothetical protein